jgi:hypothetical protein
MVSGRRSRHCLADQADNHENQHAMNSIIYAFGLGLSFALGAFVGTFVCRWSMKQALITTREAFEKHQERVEDRLSAYVVNTDRIAKALESLTGDKSKP